MDIDEIKFHMKKLAEENKIPSQFKDTWNHSSFVWRHAKSIADKAIINGFKLDLYLLKQACFVHDIGRMFTGSKASKELMPSIEHGPLGYKFLSKYDPKLARSCVAHLGGIGLSKKESGLSKDIFANSIEERILAYCDARTQYQNGKIRFLPYCDAIKRFKKHGYVGKLLKNEKFIKKLLKH